MSLKYLNDDRTLRNLLRLNHSTSGKLRNSVLKQVLLRSEPQRLKYKRSLLWEQYLQTVRMTFL